MYFCTFNQDLMLQMSKRDFKDKQTSREKKKHVRIHFILNEYLAFIKFCSFWLTLRRMIYLLGKPNTIKKFSEPVVVINIF